MRKSKVSTAIKIGANLRAQNRLEEIRTRIDQLDAQISALLNERLNLAVELTQVKARLGMPIKDSKREEQVLQKVSQAGSNEAISMAIRDAYERLMELSRKVQHETPIDKGSTLYFPQITIVGLGAIGGSLARLVKRRLPGTKIIGFDREEVLVDALQEKVIDKAASDLKQAISRSTLVILAASPGQNLKLLEQLAPLLSKRKLVVDVTSTKGKINQLAERLDLKGADFIGGHPLFGSEKTGFAASKEIRAEGSTFCVVAGAKSSEISVHRLIRWLGELNLQVETATAQEHDAIVARTSHLVQLLAVLLGSQLCKGVNDEELAKRGRLSGPSLRQMSRLMKSPSSLWGEIIEQNKDDVLLALNEMESALVDLINSLQKDGVEIGSLFESAKRLPTALEKLDNKL